MNNLPMPEPKNVASGNAAENWSYFTEQWADNEIATGLSDKDEKIRVATLRGVVGKDCYNIDKKLPLDNENKEKIKSILDALEEYFKPDLNVTYERFIFNTCDQQNHESIDECVKKLRGLSETCEFGTLQDSLIKDRILLGTKNEQVQVTWLNQKDLTLDKALSLCRNSELTEQYLIRINDASTVRAVQKSINKKEKERKLDQINCEYCCLKQAKRKCPAYGKICRKCNKRITLLMFVKLKLNQL